MGAKIEEKHEGKVRLMFQDEAGFGRINKPKYCCCYCNTVCMELYLQELSKQYPKDEILLVCDVASWHKANGLEIPDNIHLAFIPPRTPEMNPIEQIWKEIRKLGFRNEVFPLACCGC